MNKFIMTSAMLACAVFSLPASAGTRDQPIQTELLLELQRTNQQASLQPQTQLAIEQEKSIERFMKTYDYEIPREMNASTGFRVGQ